MRDFWTSWHKETSCKVPNIDWLIGLEAEQPLADIVSVFSIVQLVSVQTAKLGKTKEVGHVRLSHHSAVETDDTQMVKEPVSDHCWAPGFIDKCL